MAPSSRFSRDAARRPGNNCGVGIKSVVVDPTLYNWELDNQLDRPMPARSSMRCIRGFTNTPVQVYQRRGKGPTGGVIDKIPYLQSLGITAVELLPIQHYDAQDAPDDLTNYWGYSPIAFFAPHQGYSSGSGPLAAIDEFRDMVKALHRAGIEVILDVVFNHTAEGGADGHFLLDSVDWRTAPTTSSTATMWVPAMPTTVGPAIPSTRTTPIVRRMIMDCLRYWVSEMRGWLPLRSASVMARDTANPGDPVPAEIESDLLVRDTKLISEPWDLGPYGWRTGQFPAPMADWNDRYRNSLRTFWLSDAAAQSKGHAGQSPADLGYRLAGSADLFGHGEVPGGRSPLASVNFITAHDGFTLRDLTSYDRKHNNANGEDNRDGTNDNHSWNHGSEGPASSEDPDGVILALRRRSMRNLLGSLLTSAGTPMLVAGDEIGRTQRGNNNAYCQDNAVSWFDWRTIAQQADLLRFVRLLIYVTQDLAIFRKERFWLPPDHHDSPSITWHGVLLNEPDWSYYSHTLAFEVRSAADNEHVHVILNAYKEPLEFELPDPRIDPKTQAQWLRIVDTALASPDEIRPPTEAPAIAARSYTVQPRSAVVLLARPLNLV